MTSDRTAVYRIYDSAGELLYIGITRSPRDRFVQHAATKKWWADVDPAQTRIEWFAARDEAETVELAAIRVESPRHNIVTGDQNGCARFLPKPVGTKWGRPAWSTDKATQQQRAALDEISGALVEIKDADREVQEAIKAAKATGVPARFLAAHLDQGRATLYRNLGSSKEAGR